LKDRVLPDKPFRAQPTWVLYTLTITDQETPERRSLTW